MSSVLPWLGSIGSEGGGITDGSEMSAGRHLDGDCWGRVLFLVGRQEGWL